MPTALHPTHQPARTRRTHRPWRALAAAVALAVLGACRDAAPPTAPALAPAAAPRAAVAGTANGQPVQRGQVWTFSYAVDDGRTAVGLPLPTFSQPVLLDVTLSGVRTATHVTHPPYNFSVGPRGMWSEWPNYGCIEGMHLGWAQGYFPANNCYGAVPSAPVSGYVMANGAGRASRQPLKGDAFDCPYGSGKPCYTRSGPFSITLTQVAAELAATADKAKVAVPGERVTVTVNRTPARITTPSAGWDVPFTVQSWRYVEDGGTVVTSSCITAQACWLYPQRSGTVVVEGTANGVADTATVRIHVGPPTLELSADKLQVEAGESVMFTGVISPEGTPYTVVGWSWESDRDEPEPAPIEPGPVVASRLPNAPANASSTSNAPAATATGVTTAGIVPPEGLPLTSPCATTDLVCSTPVFQSGTMRLTVDLAGIRTVRAVHVTANPPYVTRVRIQTDKFNYCQADVVPYHFVHAFIVPEGLLTPTTLMQSLLTRGLFADVKFYNLTADGRYDRTSGFRRYVGTIKVKVQNSSQWWPYSVSGLISCAEEDGVLTTNYWPGA